MGQWAWPAGSTAPGDGLAGSPTVEKLVEALTPFTATVAHAEAEPA
jgi:hypothetical protein